MPVPTNPNDLINLIREKIVNNTSGIIDEPTMRDLLESIIKVLDAKFSMFSPNLTEQQYTQWNLMLDYMLRETKGLLTPTSPAPTEKGKYLLSGAGTYDNLGGLVTTADKLNYAYFDGTTWKLIAVAMPSSIPVYNSANSYVSENTFTYNGSLYQVNTGQTLNAGENPETSSKVTNIGRRSNNGIYDQSATGVNISKLYGIKDLRIENPQSGKIYTVTSVVKDANNTTINIYASDDNVGTGYGVIVSFVFANTEGISQKTFINADKGEIFTIIVNTSEIPTGAFTNMWANQYKLKDSVFIDGNGTELITIKELSNKVDTLFPFTSKDEKYLFFNGAIKEMYLFGITPQDIKITTALKNKDGVTEISFYNSAVTTKLCEFKKTSAVSGMKIEPLVIPSTTTIVGYMLIDWDRITDNTITVYRPSLKVPLLNYKIFKLENSPIIYSHFNGLEDTKFKNLIYKGNIIEDSEFENIYYHQYSSVKNSAFSNSEQYAEMAFDNIIGANLISATRIKSGYVIYIKFDISYLKSKLNVGDWVAWGCWMKIKPATTGDAVSAAYIDIEGLAITGNRANAVKTSTEWQWVSNKVQITKIDDVISLYVQVDQNNIADWSAANGLKISVSKLYLEVFKSSTDIPNTITYTKSLKTSALSFIQNEIYRLFSKFFAIGQFNNEFYFDDAQIDHLISRFIGIIPNFNLPHTKNYGFLTTDIMNGDVLTDSSPDFDWMKAKSPNFFFNGKRKGCMVLFDETGQAYIINQNGEKKLINLL